MPRADSTQSPRVEQALRVRLDEVASFLFARRFAHVARLLHTYVAAKNTWSLNRLNFWL
jgi:hypothetical protein